jgi:hypothetical protein
MIIRVWVGNEEVANGPFPITEAQLAECRRRFRKSEEAKMSILDNAPQTIARVILEQVVPSLSAFDRICLGFAVVSTEIRTEVVG